MKHTPGPWNRIIADGYTVRHPQIYSDTGPVANATWLGDGRLDELNANARLIAAAPDLLKQRDELLEALTRLEFAAQCRDNTSGDPCRLMVVKAELAEAAAQARAAIAKAGGES